MAVPVQLAEGYVGSGTGFETASVVVSAGDLLVIDFLFVPNTTPVEILPIVTGLGGTWERHDSGVQEFEQIKRYRCELEAGATGTVDVDWSAISGGSSECIYSLKRITGHVPGANGANALLQTARSAGNTVTLGPLSDPANEVLGFFLSLHFNPTATPIGAMEQIGGYVAGEPDTLWRGVDGLSPENTVDNTYGFTWSGSFAYRALISEIASISGTPVGTSEETDSAFAPAASKLSEIGLASETDSAFAPVASKLSEIGLASETDSAFAPPAQLRTPYGLAVETSSAFAPDASKVSAHGRADETDVAFTTADTSTRVPYGLAVETSDAFSPPAEFRAPWGLALESSEAFGLVAIKLGEIGRSEETDAAFALSPPSGAVITVSLRMISEGIRADLLSARLDPVADLRASIGLPSGPYVFRTFAEVPGSAPPTRYLFELYAGGALVLSIDSEEDEEAISYDADRAELTVRLSAEQSSALIPRLYGYRVRAFSGEVAYPTIGDGVGTLRAQSAIY